MTKRFLTLTVLLKEETREDDALPIMEAIRMIKGVSTVEGNVHDISQWAAESRVRNDLLKKLIGVLRPDRK